MKKEDPHGSMINLGTETQPRMVPVRHVQPVTQGSKGVSIPRSLLGGVKGEDATKERLAKAVQLLADKKLKEQKELFLESRVSRTSGQTYRNPFHDGKTRGATI